MIEPIFDYVLKLEREQPDRVIAVVLSELVERRWYQRFLHNQRARHLTDVLTQKGGRRIVAVNVPWNLDN